MIHYPLSRPRRMRHQEFSRRLMRENHLSTHDLIYPVFIVEGQKTRQPVASMPGVEQLSIDELLKTAETCLTLDIPVIALFPAIEPHLKDNEGSAALDPQGLVPRAIQQLKIYFPELGVLTDVALDPYTSHGQDGILDTNGHILNDITVAALTQQALIQAQAGADIIAPSDMMDGRILSIRKILEKEQYYHTKIMAYSAKYASAFYGPFREAIGSSNNLGKSNKMTYQMDPANSHEALREVALDIEEGADMIMVKPGLPYLDIIQKMKDHFLFPTYAYQVSGEYAMIKAAAQQGWLDHDAIMMESMLAFKRAGADGVLTYFALDIARKLRE